jgi:hypothetical protein
MNLKNLNKHGVISTVLIVSAFLIAALGVSQGDVLAQSMSINKTTAAAVSAPTSPTGTVQSVTPKFVWEGVNGASLYSFVVLKGTNIVYSKLKYTSNSIGRRPLHLESTGQCGNGLEQLQFTAFVYCKHSSNADLSYGWSDHREYPHLHLDSNTQRDAIQLRSWGAV